MGTSAATRQFLVWVRLAAALIVLPPAISAAQEPVKSFVLLNTRLKAGDTIWVTDAQGREIKGKIRGIGASAITLDRGGPEPIQADAIRVITERGSRPIRRGALWGLIVGGALGSAVLIPNLNGRQCGDWGACSKIGMISATFLVGVGAGIGAVVGAMTPGTMRVVYQAPGASPRARFSVAPVFTPRGKGVAVAFSF